MASLLKIIFIVGPTAVGKSLLALKLAHELNGEIISCDSMQVYREVNIASNKPTDKELKDIPHHLVNILSVSEEFDVAYFNLLANAAIKDVLKRKCVPIVVGGSGMYMQVLLDGIFDGPIRNDELRDELEKDAEANGTEKLYNRLQKLDSEAAKKIHSNDSRRIIRALEVCLSGNKQISVLQKDRQGLWGNFDIRLIGLKMNREDLYALINQRVDIMFKQGLVKEAESLNKFQLSKTAQSLIGIKEIVDHLKGKTDLDTAKELIKRNTRRFAKRQMTWFRKEERITWLDVNRNESTNDLWKRIKAYL